MNKKLMLFVVAIALATASPLAAQTHHHYKLIDVGTFGGPGSFGADPPAPRPLNNLGIVVGGADTATPDANFPNLCLYCGPNIFHAFQFHNGVQADLGALPGANSSLASWVSDNGLIVGWSENGAIRCLERLNSKLFFGRAGKSLALELWEADTRALRWPSTIAGKSSGSAQIWCRTSLAR